MKNLLVIALLMVAIISTTNAQIQSDKSDAVWTIVVPKAASQDINMNQCLLGSGKDSVITDFVQNIGAWKCRIDSIYFRGADADAFSLVSGFPVYTIPISGTHAGEIHFFPKRLGMHTAEIVIITQSDTIVQKIIGEGIQPELEIINKFIDFGKVYIGNHKDTLQAVTIKNIGTSPLFIAGTKHNKPNDVDFTTIAGGGTFTLKAGEICKMDLRFTASSPGRTSGLLEFSYNGVGSPAKVQLYAEALDNKPLIITEALPFSDISCVSNEETKVKISNNGGLPLIIKEINKIGADAAQFIVNEALPIIIEKDSTKEITVQFQPTSVGTKSIDLEIKSNADPDTVVKVTLTAKKDTVCIIPEYSTYNLGYICPNETKDTLITLKNSGTLKSGAYLSANPNITFSKDNFCLDVGNSDIVNISYKATGTPGPFTENFSIIDSICGYIRVVQIVGEITNQDLSVETIDLGYICPNVTIDTVLTIENIGKQKFFGKLAPSSNVSLSTNKFALNPKESANISFSINPLVVSGSFTGNITITDSVCGYSKTVSITGLVESPHLDASQISISCIIGQSNDGVLAIENKSDIQAIIQNAPVITAPFSISGNQFPLIIPAKGIKNITITYMPTDNTVQTEKLQFLVEPCNITYETSVKGIPSTATAILRTDTLSAYAGDTLNIPIYLRNEYGLSSVGVTSINTDLVFNPTMLTPQDRNTYPIYSINDKQAKISIKNLPLQYEKGKPIINIPFIVGLGNEEICPLILQNIVTNGGPSNIQSEGGSFKLLGICREGGTRLYLPSGKAEILAIIPNPASDNVEIKLNLIEDGPTNLCIYNTSGSKVEEFNLTGKTGLQIINIDLRTFSTGLFFIQLQTPTVLTNQKLMIIR